MKKKTRRKFIMRAYYAVILYHTLKITQMKTPHLWIKLSDLKECTCTYMHACFKFVSLIIYISIFFTQEIVIFLFYTLYTYPVISTKSVSFFLLYLECMLTRNQYLCLIYMVSIFNKIPHMFYMLKICYCFHL